MAIITNFKASEVGTDWFLVSFKTLLKTVCTFLFTLSSSIVTAWWSLWSVSVQNWQTHFCSSLQNISSSLSCFLHILSCRFFTGSISLWSFKVATLWWGSRWVSQYEVRHTRQDLRAGTCSDVAAQTSHTTSPGLAVDSGEAEEQIIIFLNVSASSLKAVLMLISGWGSNVLSQVGHWQTSLLSHKFWMQAWQKLCPQGVVTGSVNTCWQMEHWNCFSGNMLPEAAIVCRTVKKRTLCDQIRKMFDRGSACKDLYIEQIQTRWNQTELTRKTMLLSKNMWY